MKKIKMFCILFFAVSFVASFGTKYMYFKTTDEVLAEQDKVSQLQDELKIVKENAQESYIKQQLEKYGLTENSWNPVPYSAVKKISDVSDLEKFLLSFSRKDPSVEIFYPTEFKFSSSEATAKMDGMLFIRRK